MGIGAITAFLIVVIDVLASSKSCISSFPGICMLCFFTFNIACSVAAYCCMLEWVYAIWDKENDTEDSWNIFRVFAYKKFKGKLKPTSPKRSPKAENTKRIPVSPRVEVESY